MPQRAQTANEIKKYLIFNFIRVCVSFGSLQIAILSKAMLLSLLQSTGV
jgi:hypothetical protein